MPSFTQRMLKSGFKEWKPGLWLKFRLVKCKSGRRMIGAGVWKIGDNVLYAGGSVAFGPCIAEAAQRVADEEALADLIENLWYAGADALEGIEIGGKWKERWKKFRAKSKDRWKKFKTKVNKVATKIAQNKVVQKIRGGFAKVLESPVGDVLANVGAKFLQIYGVPAPVAKFAINQHRFKQVDRLKEGGWAGVIARSTDKGANAKTIAKEWALREARASGKAALRTLGGGLGLGKKIGGKILGKLGKKAGGKLLGKLLKGGGAKLLKKIGGKGGLKLLGKLGGKKIPPKIAELLGGKLGTTSVKVLAKRPEGRKVIHLLAQRAAKNVTDLARRRIAQRKRDALVKRARPSRSRPLGPVVLPKATPIRKRPRAPVPRPGPRPRPRPRPRQRQRARARQQREFRAAYSEFLRYATPEEAARVTRLMS